MGLNQNYYEIRQQAIEWLKKEKPDFSEGVKILQEAGYKSYAVAMIAKRGADNKFAREKLFYEMNAYIRLWVNPTAEEHADEEPTAEDPETIIMKEINPATAECINQGYPDIIRRCLHEFYAQMKLRQAHHKEALELIGDDDVTNAKRKELFKQIEAISERMDALWLAKENYDKEKILPDESLFVCEVKAPSESKPKTEDLPDMEAMSLEELKKLKRNYQAKRTKTNNQLEYQQEKKADKPNPMPEGPKRLGYEKKVQLYTEQIEQIDYRIVELS